eukprot:396277-Rhodomonas_salina.2
MMGVHRPGRVTHWQYRHRFLTSPHPASMQPKALSLHSRKKGVVVCGSKTVWMRECVSLWPFSSDSDSYLLFKTLQTSPDRLGGRR